jgi:predicted  nucleic acid-binding Zn-ribbon protein
MSQPLQLFNLQKIDTNLDNIRARLKEIENALNDDSLLVKTQEEADITENNYLTAKKELKQAEYEVETQQKKIDNNQKILYSGSVTNPKELEDLQNEAEALARFLAVLEDRQLEKMVACEEVETLHQAAQKKLDQIKEEIAEESTELTTEKKNLLEQVDKLESEREQHVSMIDFDNLTTYSTLRETHRGVAVAEVKDKTCTACGSALSASLAQAARSPNKVSFCESCGRILYTK